MKKLLVILVLFISFFNISYAEEIVNLSKDTSSGYKKFFKSLTGSHYKSYGMQIVNIEDEEIIVSVSSNGYVKSVPSTSYKKQGRGGKGVKAASSDEDVIEHLLSTSVHSYLLFFTDQGKVYRAKAHEIPKTNRTARGSLIQMYYLWVKMRKYKQLLTLEITRLRNFF